MPRDTTPNQKPLFTVVAAIIQLNGKILICQRRKDGPFPLKWEFPGGKVLAGEEPSVALARELEEELGVRAEIDAEISRVRHKYAEHAREIELLFFVARLESAEVKNFAFEKVIWEAAGRLMAYDFLEADRGIVERLARGEVRLAE